MRALLARLKETTGWRVAARLACGLRDNSVTDTAAQLSYYFLISLFPFLFFLVTLTAYLPVQGAVEGLLDRLAWVMPGDALALVQAHLDMLLNNPQPRLLTLGLLLTLWTSSRGLDALRKGLNLAYATPESRPFWRTQLTAAAMTVSSALLILVGFAAFVLGGKLGEWLAGQLNVAELFAVVWSWLRWPFTALAVMLAAALCYWMLPNGKRRFRYVTPGSVTATGLWLLSTWGFTRFVEQFGRFNVTYGSIAGVMVLLLWLYISGLVFLVGGELDAAVAQVRQARAGTEPAEDEAPALLPPGAAKNPRAAEEARTRWRLWRDPLR
jgi:membrane protein